jgi:hypothetical protein
MESKQTAVEWLVNELENHHIKIDIKNTVAYQQAKEIEKEYSLNAFFAGYNYKGILVIDKHEQYYNETYGK